MPVSKGKRSRHTARAEEPCGEPLWVPIVMFALLFTGTLVIVVNYLGILPGQQQNRYLLLGLAEITAGFVMATFYR